MNNTDQPDRGTPCMVSRPPISTNDNYTIEKFDILEQAELYAAMVDGEVCEHISTDYIGDDTKTLVYESSTGWRLRVKAIC